MPITVTCDECSESNRLKDDAVGKRFKCKGCGKSLKVEVPAPPKDDFSNFDDAELNDEDAEAEDAEFYSRKKAPKRATSSRKSSQSISINVPLVVVSVLSVYLWVDSLGRK